MKVFIRNISLFCGIIFIPLIIFSFYIFYANYKLAADYKIESNINTLVIGDSHTQKAINDRYFPNAINLSQSSECFIYSYSKLLEILKHHPNIKTVLLGCSFHSFSSYYDEFVFGKYGAETSARYFFIMPLTLKLEFLLKNNNLTGRYLLQILSNGITNLGVRSGQYSFLGNYEAYRTSVKLSEQSIRKRVNTHYFQQGKMDGFSSLNVYYLSKVVELCKERKIKLILLNTPMHKYYIENVPDKFKDKFYSLIKSKKLNLIEFEKLKLDDSCFLPDGDHVNEEGARLTTLFLVNVLKPANSAKMEGVFE